MFASLPARLALVALLVLFQALYAGHSVQHDLSGQPECNVCLQTSAGAAVLPCGAVHAVPPIHAPERPASCIAPAVLASLILGQPSRAPPVLPV